MRKSIIKEIVTLIVCDLTAFVIALLFCDFTPSGDLSLKIFNIGTETTANSWLYLFWLFSIFIINSLRQIKLKYESLVTNIVLLIVSLRLLYFIYGRINSITRLKIAMQIDQCDVSNNNKFLYLLWTISILLIVTTIIILFSFQKHLRQRMTTKKNT